MDAPSYATFLEIMTKDTDKHIPYYRFYLGQNMKNDFNIIPNRHYVLPITISDKGDASSNNHVINPLKGDVQTLYYSVPFTRINKIWSSNDGKLNLLNDKTLLATTEWVAEVTWQDQSRRLINFCSKKGVVNDENKNYSDTDESFFYFKPINGASGNAVIGVLKKTKNKGKYLWRWNLWLADYRPEYTTTWQEALYSYVMKGEHAHCHVDNNLSFNIWDTKYRNKYIMDRYNKSGIC